MALTLGSDRIDLNGVTPVTIVTAPGAGVTRVVLALRVFNLDTAAVTVTLQKNKGGVVKTIGKSTALAVDALWTPVDRSLVVILPATTHSLELFMSGAAATTNPHAEAEYLDRS